MQQKVKLNSRARVLLGLGRLHPRISAELADSYVASINAIDTLETQVPFDLIKALCADNRRLFTETRAKHPLPNGFAMKD